MIVTFFFSFRYACILISDTNTTFTSFVLVGFRIDLLAVLYIFTNINWATYVSCRFQITCSLWLRKAAPVLRR